MLKVVNFYNKTAQVQRFQNDWQEITTHICSRNFWIRIYDRSPLKKLMFYRHFFLMLWFIRTHSSQPQINTFFFFFSVLVSSKLLDSVRSAKGPKWGQNTFNLALTRPNLNHLTPAVLLIKRIVDCRLTVIKWLRVRVWAPSRADSLLDRGWQQCVKRG